MRAPPINFENNISTCVYHASIATRTMFKAAVTFLAMSTVAALDYYGTPELIADTRISSASAIPPNVTYAAPISPLTPGNGTFLVFGTDELNCSTKDASGANVKFAPTRGFVQFNYTLPTGGFHAFDFTTYAPDGMSNSFYAQHDGGATLIWNTKMAKVPTRMTMEVDSSIVFTAKCFDLAPGMHNVRLYAREPGAAVNRLRVWRLPPLAVNATSGCNPCRLDGGDELHVVLRNFCGQPMLHPGLIRLNGEPCTKLTMTSDNDILCTTPRIQRNIDNHVVLTLHATPEDYNGVAPPLSVPLMSEPPKEFPKWAIGVIAAVGAVLVLLLPTPFLRRYWANRHAPTDTDSPVAVAFVTIPALDHVAEGDPARASAAHKIISQIVRTCANTHGVYVVRRVGTADLIVARDVRNLANFGSALQARIEAEAKNPLSALSNASCPAKNKDKDDTILTAVSVHLGTVSSLRDEETDRYDYNGPAMEECARLADAANGGQIVVSNKAACYLRSDLDASETLEHFTDYALDDEEADLEDKIYTLQTGAFRNMVFQAPGKEGEDGNTQQRSSMTAALQQAQGGFATKPMTILLIRLLIRARSRDVPTLYRKSATLIAELAGKHKGVLHTFHNDLIVVTFNAKVPAVGHAKKAALAAVAIQNEVLKTSNRRVRAFGALASGRGTFGVVNEQTSIVYGPVMTQAEVLLAKVTALALTAPLRHRSAHKSGKSNRNKGSTVGMSRKASRLNVTNASGERREPQADDLVSEDDSETSGADSCHTADTSLTTGTIDPVIARLHNSHTYFVCDGHLMRDLQHTVRCLILDLSVGSVSCIDGCAGRSNPEELVTLAAIISERKMSEDEEWQYDLDRADNSEDPVATVNRAFIAYAKGETDNATKLLQQVDRMNADFAACQPAVIRLNRLLFEPASTPFANQTLDQQRSRVVLLEPTEQPLHVPSTPDGV
jgi:class 3 adenylate cyclase